MGGGALRVLIVEPHADGLLDLALRAKAHGHQVRYFCRDYHPVKAPIGRGLIERVADWSSSKRWADLVILGSLGYFMAEFDRWQAEGIPVIGAPGQAGQWELDRLAGMRAFREAGIPVPPYRHVATLDEAIEYARKRDEGMAVKPSGDVTDKSLSFVGKTAKEVVWRLARWKREGRKFPQGLICQDRIEGVEMAVGAWIGPSGFAEGWEENFEEKKLFAGGVGPNCGEAGTVLRLVTQSKLAKVVLKPLEGRLTAMNYVGNVDVNCIIDNDGAPWPLEFTVRFGYPAINIELVLHRSDPIEFLAGLAAGKPPRTRALDEVAVGVVMALPPYPFSSGKTDEVVGVPIWGITPSIEDNVHLCNAYLDSDGQLQTSGSYVLVSAATAATVSEARNRAMRVLNRLTIPASPFWRIDIGTRLRSQIEKLNAYGYAAGLTYS
jgi:phosphoribosylamine--glycine ligase